MSLIKAQTFNTCTYTRIQYLCYDITLFKLCICVYYKTAHFISGMTSTYGSLIGVFLFCFLFNIPRFFSEFSMKMDCAGGWSVHFRAQGILKRVPGLHATYMWCYFMVGIFVPVVVLSYCNFKLIQALRQSAKLRRQFRTVKHKASTDESTNRISLTLVVIVIMYLVLVSPAETLVFLRDTILKDSGAELFNLITAFCNVLQALNFASNFVLYCIINVYFRKTVHRILFCKCREKNNSCDSSTSNTHITARYESVTVATTL